jgi:hypothetical protein
MSQKFQKKTENFTCGNCGFKVKGDGYTNHCPKCLYSKHVDINPGDRAEKCKGMMEPVNLEVEKGEYILTQKCQKCGAEKRCRTSEKDEISALTALSERLVKNIFF